MFTDKLIIFGDSNNKEFIEELVALSACTLDLNEVKLTAIISSDAVADREELEDCRCIVKPFGYALENTSDARIITYSQNCTRGDIVALNVQEKPEFTSFEVLYGVFMSRVFVPSHSKYTVHQVFMCVCILCGWGASIDKVIPRLNEILK